MPNRPRARWIVAPKQIRRIGQCFDRRAFVVPQFCVRADLLDQRNRSRVLPLSFQIFFGNGR